MKYKFEKVDADTTKLKYKDKEFEFKRDVDLQTKMQGLYMKARTKMMVELAKDGVTKEDLIVKKKKDGKTYYDNSNVLEIEKTYLQLVSLDLYDEISKKYTNMTLQELMVDIGLTETETEEFGGWFAKALTGDVKTPSESK